MTATRTRTYADLAGEVAAAVDAGTLDRESALYREFVEAARESANRRSEEAESGTEGD